MLRRLAHAAASTALESSLLPCASGSLISFGAWGRDFTSTASSSDEQSNDRTVNFGFRKVRAIQGRHVLRPRNFPLPLSF